MARGTPKAGLSVLAAIAICMFMIASAHAAPPVISFDQVMDGGTVSYDGMGGPLIGSDIEFGFVQGRDTPANAGATLTCDGCLLDFATGANTHEPFAGSPLYRWEGGGNFTLTGDVLDENGGLLASGTLKDGTWITPTIGLVGEAGRIHLAGFGNDSFHADLAGYFQLTDADFDFNFTAIVASVVSEINGGFTSTIEETDLVNTANVPEPSNLFLLAGSLVGLGFWGRRRSHG